MVGSEKVCVATYGLNLNKPEFIKTLVELIQEWDSTEEQKAVFHLEHGKLIHMAQQDCVIYALAQRCTHILFIEDDTTYVPPGSLRKLLNYDVDVVGAFAYSRHFPHYSMIFNKIAEQKDKLWLSDELPGTVIIDPDGGFKKVDMLPWQFTIIKTSVFERIKSPWFHYDTRTERLTDFWFADRCFEEGIQLWCDTDLIVQHAGIDGINAGFYVQMHWMRAMNGTIGNWKSEMIMPIMKYSGFEVSNEARERNRQKIGL